MAKNVGSLWSVGPEPEYNRRFTVAAQDRRDAHRALGAGHNLAAILSVQAQRAVANDYTIRFQNRVYQLEPPVWPGERGGQVVIELRLDGTMALRFRDHYLKFHEVVGVERSRSRDGEKPRASKERGSWGPVAGRKGQVVVPRVRRPRTVGGRLVPPPSTRGGGHF